jgi:hypothetical protein
MFRESDMAFSTTLVANVPPASVRIQIAMASVLSLVGPSRRTVDVMKVRCSFISCKSRYMGPDPSLRLRVRIALRYMTVCRESNLLIALHMLILITSTASYLSLSISAS